MNKKVDEEFKGIKDVYILQCICTELKELCDKYEEEHNTTFKEWQKDIQANKKVIEELKQAYTDICNNDNANYIHIAFRNDLLNILEGKNEYNK